MSNEKLIDFINRQRKEHAFPQDNYGLGYFKALDDIESKIQSATEELYISKEQLARMLIEYAGYVEDLENWACDQTIDDAIEWINKKVGEQHEQ